MRNATQVRLTTGKLVTLAELTPAEMLTALRGSGSGSGMSALVEGRMSALRMSIREIDGAAVGLVNLFGGLWDTRFSARETMQLQRAFSTMHDAEPGEVAKILAAAPASTGKRQVIDAKIGDTTYTMNELGYGLVQASMSAGDKEAAPAALEYAVALDGVRRSLSAIDGVAFTAPAEWPVPCKDTAMLAAIWRELHGFGSDERPTVVPTTA